MAWVEIYEDKLILCTRGLRLEINRDNRDFESLAKVVGEVFEQFKKETPKESIAKILDWIFCLHRCAIWARSELLVKELDPKLIKEE